ncbi:MAG: DUF4332 domain-containing protein [Armatimonadetes bacterium]|nr:DUF4332 domain-containing protein [Armatimonadota bacterium]
MDEIEGIGPAYQAKLQEAGVGSVEALLEQRASQRGREDLAGKTEISGKLILAWVNRADLARIRGVGSEYADLLEAAGVDTVPELAQRNATNLAARLEELNQEKKLVRRVPTESQVSDWVAQAKSLPRIVTH